MIRKCWPFASLAHAEGFVEGAEFVNDGAISDLRVMQEVGVQSWWVAMVDEDYLDGPDDLTGLEDVS